MRASYLLPALVLGVSLLGLAVIAAEKSESTKTKSTVDSKKIDELIEKLGSDAFEDREKAYKTLDEIGAPALKALSAARESKDLETRKRAGILHERIEKRVSTARILAAKQVQFKFENVPVADAVADIAKQTGYKIKLHDPENKLKDKKVTLDTGKTTFWNALTLFCEKAGLVDGDPNQMNQGGPGVAPPPGVGFGFGGGGVQPLPPVKIQPARPLQRVPPAKKQEKQEEKKGNAAQQEGSTEAKPAVRPAKPVAKPVQGGGAPAIQPVEVPGGAPGFAPPGGGGRAWVNVEPGEIYLIPGKIDTKADTKTSFRVRSADSKNLAAKDKKHFWLMLEVTAEPKIRWHSLGAVKLDKAKDNNGQTPKSVDPLAGQNGREVGIGIAFPGGGGGFAFAPGFGGMGIVMPWSSNSLSQYAPLKFEKGDKETKSFAELTGSVTAKVLEEAESMMVVDNVMKMAGKSFEGKKSGSIEIKKVTKDKEGTVTIEFEMELPGDVQPETQQNIPIPADLLPKPGRPGLRPGIRPLPAPLPALPPAKKGNAAEVKVEKVVAQPAPAVVEVAVPVGGGGGVAIGIAMPFPGTGYAYNGLTLQDDKGKTIYAQIHPNYEKLRGGFNLGARKKMEYVAKYKAGKGMPAEPTKLVFTGRKISEVNIPFSLKDVEVK